MFRSEHRTSVVVKEHVSSEGSFNLVAVSVLEWSFLFILALLAFFGLLDFGRLDLGVVQTSKILFGDLGRSRCALLTCFFVSLLLLVFGSFGVHFVFS